MCCWTVPLIATIIGFLGSKALNKQGSNVLSLNIMLLGGALFGAIDHLWHGELFLITSAWSADLALGGLITGGITTGWGIIFMRTQVASSLRTFTHHLGIVGK